MTGRLIIRTPQLELDWDIVASDELTALLE